MLMFLLLRSQVICIGREDVPITWNNCGVYKQLRILTKIDDIRQQFC